MRKVRIFGALPAAALLATVALTPARAEQPYGAVVVYGAPLESGGRPGASFIAASQADVLDLAVERCKANTVTAQWGNCAPGHWIDTGRYLLVAAVCDARDDGGADHRLLEFMRDGVTATDEEIREAVQRETPLAIAAGGCRKVAMFDATRPELSNQEEPGVARSVAKDAAKGSVSARTSPSHGDVMSATRPTVGSAAADDRVRRRKSRGVAPSRWAGGQSAARQSSRSSPCAHGRMPKNRNISKLASGPRGSV